jgi:hypothetical protein
VFVAVELLWLAFGAAMIFKAGGLDDLLRSFRDQPLIVQAAGALLLLPWVVGLWIWQTGWPVALRVAAVVGLAWTTAYVFFPRP